MITSSLKPFITEAKAMTGVTNTGLKSEIVPIQDVFSTPEGNIIADAKKSLAGKHLKAVVEFDEKVATATTATLLIDVMTQDTPNAETCNKKLATYGPYSAAEITGKGIEITLPQEVMEAVQLVFKTGQSSETYTAGNITSALLVPWLK